MEQCPDVIKGLKVGHIFRAFYAGLGKTDLGLYEFVQWEMDNGIQHLHCVSVADGTGRPAGQKHRVPLNMFILKLDGCDHNWKRLDLFRTTEFHCTKCSSMRPFDIEKDEAA